MRINTRIAASTALLLALAIGGTANVAAAKGIEAEASVEARSDNGIRGAIRSLFNHHDARGNDDAVMEGKHREWKLDDRIGMTFGIGTVTAIDGDVITARSVKDDSVTWTVTTDSSTRFAYRGDDTLETGDRIAVAGTVTDGEGDQRAIDASSVLVADADLALAKGMVTAVDADAKTVTVATKHQGDVKVAVDADTEIVTKGDTAAFDDLVVGAKVRVQGMWNSLRDLVTAAKVRIVAGI